MLICGDYPTVCAVALGFGHEFPALLGGSSVVIIGASQTVSMLTASANSPLDARIPLVHLVLADVYRGVSLFLSLSFEG